jgi:guanylate kinase
MMRTGHPIKRRGLMLVLSSPSGAGKTTLTRMLLQDPTVDLTLSVSVTTRARRSSEVDGIHYHFIDRAEFERRRETGDLLEWAKVHDYFYGSPRRPVDAILAQGRDVLFDIDYQGTQQIQQKAPDDVVTVFILPPSMRELKARLERRAEDATEAIARRLQTARQEINRWALYDYVLVNEDLQRSFVDVLAILKAERLKRRRAEQGLAGFVDQLMTEAI